LLWELHYDKTEKWIGSAVACWIDFNNYLAHLVAVDLAIALGVDLI